jgi:hypothetical protein
MDNLSTATDIGSRIGALELGDHQESYSDGALEASGENASLQPTQVASCHGTVMSRVCGEKGIRDSDGEHGEKNGKMFHRIGDGALEAAGANAALIPTMVCNAPRTAAFCLR